MLGAEGHALARAEPEPAMPGQQRTAATSGSGQWTEPSWGTWLSLGLRRAPALGWKPHPHAHPHRRPHGCGHHREGPGTSGAPGLPWHCPSTSGRCQPSLSSPGPKLSVCEKGEGRDSLQSLPGLRSAPRPPALHGVPSPGSRALSGTCSGDAGSVLPQDNTPSGASGCCFHAPPQSPEK